MPSGDPWTGALRTDVVVVDGAVCVRLQGELDLATAPDLWRAGDSLHARLESGSVVFVDLAQLQFVDAAGLGTLVRLRNRVRAAGAEMKVLDPSPLVRRIFEHARLGAILEGGAAAANSEPAPT